MDEPGGFGESRGMSDLLWFLLGLAAFWAILYLAGRVLHLDRHGWEIEPAYFIYRSRGLKRVVEALPERSRALWRVLCNVGVGLAAGQMVYVIYLFARNLLMFARPAEGGGGTPVFLILPGITMRLHWLPYFLLSAAVVVITHEMAHGVAARLDGIPVTSAGVILALVIPGGFVEPDEEQFKKASTPSKLRVMSAGSSTNLVTGLLALLLLSSLYAPASGVLILNPVEGWPIDRAGLGRWDVIYAINGTETPNVWALQNYMIHVTAGENLTLETNRGSVTIKTGTDPDNKSRALLGLHPVAQWGYWNYYPWRLGAGRLVALGYHVYTALEWVQMLGLGMAVVMMLPAYPFDGERFLYYASGRLARGRRREVRVLFNAVGWGLLAGNVVSTFVRYGLLLL